MTNSQSLSSHHLQLLLKESRGEDLKPLLDEHSRLTAAAIHYAISLEAELAAIAEQLDAFLAKHRKIAHIWDVRDVKEVRPDLTDEQAWEVLQAVAHGMDSGLGICWNSIEDTADEMFPDEEGNATDPAPKESSTGQGHDGPAHNLKGITI
jgi:hypothetical protein